jgi:predicted component of type VI protein secretion system
MEAKLIVVRGNTNRGTIALKLPTIIGRSRQATLTVAHPMISRQHCEITEVDGLLMIRDLSSLNGSFLDGKRIAVAPLPPGAEFTIGPVTLRVEYDYSGDLSALPAVQEVASPQTPPMVPTDAGEPAIQVTQAEEAVPEIPTAASSVARPQPLAGRPPLFGLMETETREAPSPAPVEPDSPPESDSELDFSVAPPAEAAHDADDVTFTEMAGDQAVAGPVVRPTGDENAGYGISAPATEEVAANDVAAEEPEQALRSGPDQSPKSKAGWWPFGGKGAKGSGGARPDQGPKSALPEDEMAEATPTPPPAELAAERPSSGDSDHDEMAFLALQDEPESQSEKPAQKTAKKPVAKKPADDDVDSFFEDLE